MNTSLKRKLNFNEMIEHLDGKNVKFDLISKENAKKILQTSNYFYKITAYRKNFEKNNRGQYIKLDFKLLQDLATIDMRLRYLVLHMSLDIEHSIKTKLLTDITNDPTEDGYSIVTDFLAYDGSSIDDYMHALKKESHYNYGLYVKHHSKPPIWVLFEVMTFGKFGKFVEYYYKRKNRPSPYKEIQQVLKYVKNIRNTAAHNSPIHDLITLIYVHYTYIESDGIKKARYGDFKQLLDRTKREINAYDKQDGLIAVFKYFSKLLDFII